MKLTRINYNGGYLWVTNGINTGDYFFANQAIRKCVEIKEGDYPFKDEIGNFHSKHWNSNKVIAQSNLFLPYIPYVEIGKVDIEVEMEETFKENIIKTKSVLHDNLLFDLNKKGFTEGYLAAKEKYAYTEEDLAKAHFAGASFAYGRKSANKEEREMHFKSYLESLNELPESIEIETEFVSKDCHKECAETKSFKGTEHEGIDVCEDGCIRAILKPVTYTKDNKIYLKIK